MKGRPSPLLFCICLILLYFFEARSCYVAQAGLELALLSASPELCVQVCTSALVTRHFFPLLASPSFLYRHSGKGWNPGPHTLQGTTPAGNCTPSPRCVLTRCLVGCSGWPGMCVRPALAFRTSGLQGPHHQPQHTRCFFKTNLLFLGQFPA